MVRVIDCPTHCQKGTNWVANLCIFNCIILHFSIAKYSDFMSKIIYEISTVKGKYLVYKYEEKNEYYLAKEEYLFAMQGSYKTAELAVFALKKLLGKNFPKNEETKQIVRVGKQDALREALLTFYYSIKEIWLGLGALILIVVLLSFSYNVFLKFGLSIELTMTLLLVLFLIGLFIVGKIIDFMKRK